MFIYGQVTESRWVGSNMYIIVNVIPFYKKYFVFIKSVINLIYYC